MGKDCDPWQFRNFNHASNAGAPAVARQSPNPMALPTYADPYGFFQLNSPLAPHPHPTGLASGQKRFMVFDRSGDQTNLIFSSFGSQLPYPDPVANDFPASNETNVSNGNANEEMHEDTEEIDALLYSDSDNDYEEDEASTGHYSPNEAACGNLNRDEEDVASSAVLPPAPPPPAKRRRTDPELDPSLADTASSTRCAGGEERKRAKREKIQETVGVLRRIIPGGKGKDAASVLDEAIRYLKSPAAPLQEIMLEFRAGKMSLEGKSVVPDTRKGLIRIGRGEEGLVHFQWHDRMQNIIELDQIIFPDEAVFERVTQSSGRVYILKFSSDDRKFFFWMQEPQSDGDSQLCTSVNCFINRPIDILGEDEAEASVPMHMSEVSEDTADDDLSSRAGNLVDHNMTGESAEVTSSAGPVQLADLQRILRSIQPADAIEDPDAGLGLGDILKPELLLPLIETFPFEERLASYLPEGPWTPESIIQLLQSAPFRQQVETFTHVLRTGQIDLAQFGIDPSKYKFTVHSFLEALEDSVAKSRESGEAEPMQDENKDAQPGAHGGSDNMDES